MNRRLNGPDIWRKGKRVSGVILGGLVWWMGYGFSRGGFEYFLDLPKDHWMGFVLGIVVTWLQINLNEGLKDQPMLFVSGILSYLYGFFTNWLGLFAFQSKFFLVGVFTAFEANPFEWFTRVVLTIVIGILLDALPEHMITFGLFGESYAGDLLKSLFQGTKIRNNGQKRSKISDFNTQRQKYLLNQDKKSQNGTSGMSGNDKRHDILRMTPKQLAKKYDVSERTAYRWKKNVKRQTR